MRGRQAVIQAKNRFVSAIEADEFEKSISKATSPPDQEEKAAPEEHGD